MAFEGLGYSIAYTQLDARNFLLPQRHTRIWMWAIRSDVAAAPAAGEVLKVLLQFEWPQPAPLVRFLGDVANDKQARHTINEREQAVLNCVLQERALQLQPEELFDLVVDIAKSVSRAPWCVQATPCVLPNSRLHWRRQQRVLDAREMVALQGIWPRDFPAHESWCKSDKR